MSSTFIIAWDCENLPSLVLAANDLQRKADELRERAYELAERMFEEASE